MGEQVPGARDQVSGKIWERCRELGTGDQVLFKSGQDRVGQNWGKLVMKIEFDYLSTQILIKLTNNHSCYFN